MFVENRMLITGAIRGKKLWDYAIVQLCDYAIVQLCNLPSYKALIFENCRIAELHNCTTIIAELQN